LAGPKKVGNEVEKKRFIGVEGIYQEEPILRKCSFPNRPEDGTDTQKKRFEALGK
jgi:hypothetical protein